MGRLEKRTLNQAKIGIRKVSMHAMRRLISETPKGYTGQTRKSWKIERHGSEKSFGFSINNESRIMKFLEFGTKDHGPKTARFLFIPLNRKTALGGLRKNSKFGKDYVLTKRVKGIKALNITSKRARIVDKQVDATLRSVAKRIM